ncbi:hypothetical protein ACOME3_001462 [Neoechinorhynchus agilis]
MFPPKVSRQNKNERTKTRQGNIPPSMHSAQRLPFDFPVVWVMNDDGQRRSTAAITNNPLTRISTMFDQDAMLGNRRMSSFLRNPSLCLFSDDSYESRQKNIIIKRTWWKEAVVYQVYWRSFYDSNNDGIGDLQGVIDKLDYIRSLGVGIIWLNPFYESPDYDNGYDVSNYTSVMKIAGDIETFDRLLWEIHSRRMKLIIDLVVNHTSYKHEWFLESRSSKDNPKRDWYIWRDPTANNDPPTNWQSYFTPSTWEYDDLNQWLRFLDFFSSAAS